MTLASIKKKLILGTVQLGLSYGINNSSGKPDQTEADRILSKAADEEIFLLDSAEAYGDSLNVIGSYLKRHKNHRFEVSSKFIGDGESLKKRVETTCSAAGLTNLYSLMYHRFSDYRSGLYKKELLDLAAEGKIKRIGVSIYDDRELETVLGDQDISIIQMPFHPFDARPERKELMAEARSAGKEVHVRSIFLQGLFFKNGAELTGNLTAFKESLERFHGVISRHGGTIRQACLNYALHQPFIDRVVIGVETARQLEENTNSILADCPGWILGELEEEPVEKTLLNPSTWKP